MDLLEFLYDYLEDRAHAAALIRQRRPFALGFMGAWAGGVAVFVAEAAAGRLGVLSFSLPALALTLLWQTAALFALTGVLHLVLDMSGARGDASALFVHLGLAELAWLAAVPAVLVVRALSRSEWPMRLVFLAAGLWSLALKARGLRDEYGVGQTRAWLTLASPYLALAALAAFTLALALGALLLEIFS